MKTVNLLSLENKAISDEFLDSAWKDAWEHNKVSQFVSTGQEEALWRAAGRATKANPNKEDGSWWEENGRKMLERWKTWRTGTNGWSLWVTPEGIPAIELGLNPTIAGVRVQMHIDRVMVNPEGEMVIVDLKTGQRVPSSDLQLAFYAVGLEMQFGIRPKYGTYWMARDGVTSPVVDLDFYTIDKIEEIVAQFDKARKEGIFVPNFSHCKMCDLVDKCKWTNKEKQ